MGYSTILHELTHSRACGMTQKALREPEAYGWTACVNAKSPSNSESLAMFCLGTDKIQLGYILLEDGEVLTASQYDDIPPVSDSSRSGDSSGASSPGVDDPDRYVASGWFPHMLWRQLHCEHLHRALTSRLTLHTCSLHPIILKNKC